MSDSDNKKRFKANTPTRRFMKLAGMSASIARNYAGHKVKGMFSDEATKKQSEEQMYADMGKRIAETLGEMKGAVMKVGQIASQMKEMLPPEVGEALEVLQKESPPMPYPMIRRQIIASLGKPPEELFKTFEEQPFAAASIGQVHRATTLDGQDVVVKIQYPGVRESCESDLKHLRRIFKLAGLAKVSDEVMEETFQEVKIGLLNELDYTHEAQNVAFFAEHYRDNPRIVTPECLSELSTDTVLTLTYVPGDSLKDLKPPQYSQEMINDLGRLIFDTMGRQIYHLKKVHTDPHPGNFAFRDDGTLIIYDFGAVKDVNDNVIDIHRKIVQQALENRADQMDALLTELGVRPPGSDSLPLEEYQDWLEIFAEPFAGNQPYDFASGFVHQKTADKIRKGGLSYMGKFQPSPDTMQIDRVLSGHYWNMVDMGVVASFRDIIDDVVLTPVAH